MNDQQMNHLGMCLSNINDVGNEFNSLSLACKTLGLTELEEKISGLVLRMDANTESAWKTINDVYEGVEK